MTATQSKPTDKTVEEKPVRPRLERGANGGLRFWLGDGREPVDDCRVARCFPWSLPDAYISVRDKDGNELHLFESIEDVPQENRELLADELAAEELVPRILRVHEVDDTLDITIWKVDTDRGSIEFQVKDDEDIRPLTDNCVIIRDHSGMLFEIPDLRTLDETSRGLVEDRLG